jgi:hypothetical protein
MTLKQIPTHIHKNNSDASFVSSGSLLLLKWKLKVRVRLSSSLLHVFQKIRQKFKQAFEYMKKTWHVLEEKIKHGLQTMGSLFHKDVNHTLFPRRLGVAHEWTSDLKKSQERNPALFYIYNGGSFPNESFLAAHDVDIDFASALDYEQTVNVKLSSYEFRNAKFLKVEHTLQSLINFSDEESVKNGLLDISSNAEKLLLTSTFSGVDPSIVDFRGTVFID